MLANAGVARYASFGKIIEELGELRLQPDKSCDPFFRTGVDGGPYGAPLRVNAMSPGPIDTPELNNLVASTGAGEERLKGLSKVVPLGRLSTLGGIAKAVVFLASDDSSYATGEELFMDDLPPKTTYYLYG